MVKLCTYIELNINTFFFYSIIDNLDILAFSLLDIDIKFNIYLQQNSFSNVLW